MNHLKQSLAELHAARIEINSSLQAKTQKEAEIQGQAARLEQLQKALEEHVERLNAQQSSSSHGFSKQDSDRLLFLNKQINMLSLQESEQLARIQRLQAQRDQYAVLLENNFLKKQN